MEGRFPYGGQGLVAKPVGFHGNEPLRRVAENQRSLRPPGMRILVIERARGKESPPASLSASTTIGSALKTCEPANIGT